MPQAGAAKDLGAQPLAERGRSANARSAEEGGPRERRALHPALGLALEMAADFAKGAVQRGACQFLPERSRLQPSERQLG